MLAGGGAAVGSSCAVGPDAEADVDVGEAVEEVGSKVCVGVGLEGDAADVKAEAEVEMKLPSAEREGGENQFPAPPRPVWAYSGCGLEGGCGEVVVVVGGGLAASRS